MEVKHTRDLCPAALTSILQKLRRVEVCLFFSFSDELQRDQRHSGEVLSATSFAGAPQNSLR